MSAYSASLRAFLASVFVLFATAALPTVSNFLLLGIGNISAQGGTPGGANTNIQFNDSGAFGGQSSFTFDKATNTVTLGVEATDSLITAPSATSMNTVGGELQLYSGNSTGTATGADAYVKAGEGGTTGDGGALYLQSGAGGATSGEGGYVNIIAGNAQGGDKNGGGFSFVTGNGSGDRGGGSISIQVGASGAGTTTGSGISVAAGSGGGTAGDGGDVVFQAGSAGGASNGGNVDFFSGGASGGGLKGEVRFNSSADLIPVQLPFVTSLSPNNTIIFTASRAMRVKSIVGRLEVANAGASTVVFRKAPSGTAIGSGTLLHSGSFNAAGTPATNQTLTLSGTSANLELAVGDSIGVVATGTWILAAGGITVWMTPQ